MKHKKPLILVTNDDGITSRGIKALVEVAKNFGDVCVIAPDKPQSGMGHAITVHSGIIIAPAEFPGATMAFSCSGTPADCVKLGKYHLLKQKPDICLSGINHGANMSLNVIYSGTMSAALEGALEGIPSIGISLCNNDREISMESSIRVTTIMLETFLKNKPDNNLCLNVNIPDIPFDKMKGLRFCRQGRGNWKEYYEEHKNPEGKEYLWLTGKFENFEKASTDTDLWALDNNYVSVVPVHGDMTNYTELKRVGEWEMEW
jgi:5'-nucleotidase